MTNKYCKKPIVVEAIEWDGTNYKEVHNFAGDCVILNNNGTLFIKTLEGVMQVGIGDMVIKGLAGEFYPCRADIFWNSYDDFEELK